MAKTKKKKGKKKGFLKRTKIISKIGGFVLPALGAAGGATAGSAVGTLALPGLGTLEGVAVGGTLGELAGEELNDWIKSKGYGPADRNRIVKNLLAEERFRRAERIRRAHINKKKGIKGNSIKKELADYEKFIQARQKTGLNGRGRETSYGYIGGGGDKVKF